MLHKAQPQNSVAENSKRLLLIQLESGTGPRLRRMILLASMAPLLWQGVDWLLVRSHVLWQLCSPGLCCMSLTSFQQTDTEQMGKSPFLVLEADSGRSTQGVLKLRLRGFCHMVLAKASHQHSSCSRGGEPDSVSSWEEWGMTAVLQSTPPSCHFHLPFLLFSLKIFFHKFKLEQPCDYKWSKWGHCAYSRKSHFSS